MEFDEIKEEFYKRYGVSDKFLYHSSCGALCVLLGYKDIATVPMLSCGLSMGVDMFGRKIDGNVVKIENTNTNVCLQYRLGELKDFFEGRAKRFSDILASLENYGICGGELLYNTSVPAFLKSEENMYISLVKILSELSKTELDKSQMAYICSQNDDIMTYIALMTVSKGYCSVVENGGVNKLPLPLCGYKIIIVHCNEKIKNCKRIFLEAMAVVRKVYPDVLSISDLTVEMLENMKNKLRRNRYNCILHLVNETERIKNAKTALEKCDIQGLFDEMNCSQRGAEILLGIGEEYSCIASVARKTDGVATVRCNEYGVCVIAQDVMVDYVISMINNEFLNVIGYELSFCVCDTG